MSDRGKKEKRRVSRFTFSPDILWTCENYRIQHVWGLFSFPFEEVAFSASEYFCEKQLYQRRISSSFQTNQMTEIDIVWTETVHILEEEEEEESAAHMSQALLTYLQNFSFERLKEIKYLSPYLCNWNSVFLRF